MGLQSFFGSDSSLERLFLVPEEKAFSFQQSGHPDRPCGDGKMFYNYIKSKKTKHSLSNLWYSKNVNTEDQ
jgi:hypothetical protein